MGSPVLPPLPQSLLRTKKPSQAITELVQGMRSNSGNGNPPHAEALERLQTYSDSLNGTLNAIVGYLQTASGSTTPSSTTFFQLYL